MIIGNKAKLVSSEICQKCGRCCKVFQSCFDIDMAVRFIWSEGEKIKGEDTPFRFDDGFQKKLVTFNFPCSKLEYKEGKYYCKAYNEERPDFCSTYPDHIFYNIERWNKDRIKRLLQFEKKICVGLRNVTIKDVINMLNERRGDLKDD